MDQNRPPNNPPMIEIGEFEVDTWYSAPYPQEYATASKIFICEFCLSYLASQETLAKHNIKCTLHCPPANEIYRYKHALRDGQQAELSVYEADGAKSKLYCQNLCLLAKLFLDHKTLFYDVDHFLFYILTKNDNVGSRIIGYFSKEKHCQKKNNVSCIMILPQYQSYGFGRFLIEFSYLLTKVENTLGSPEKPLSELGKLGYLNYWKYSILDVIKDKTDVSLKEISEATNMTIEDIVYALKNNNLFKKKDNEEKGRCIFIRNEDLTKLDLFRLKVNPEALRWTQYVSHYARRIMREQEEAEAEENSREGSPEPPKLNSYENDFPVVQNSAQD